MNGKSKLYREALRYVTRFTNSTFVLSFDPGIADSIVSASLVRDLKLLLKLRVNLVLYCREGSKTATSLAQLGPILSSQDIDEVAETARESGVCVVTYSPAAERKAETSVAELAVAIGANKLIYMTKLEGILDDSGERICQMDLAEARSYLELSTTNPHGRVRYVIGGGVRAKVEAALMACESGVARVHLIQGLRDGGLIEELFSPNGVGTLICDRYEECRVARPSDIPGIQDLLTETDVGGNPGEELRKHLADFIVFARDGDICGCMMTSAENGACDIRYFAIEDDSDFSAIATVLLTKALERAHDDGTDSVIIATDGSHCQDWLFVNPVLARLGFAKQGKRWTATFA
jgi:N-acetylglutamate synthase-like GNAT family acetyltransferase